MHRRRPRRRCWRGTTSRRTCRRCCRCAPPRGWPQPRVFAMVLVVAHPSVAAFLVRSLRHTSGATSSAASIGLSVASAAPRQHCTRSKQSDTQCHAGALCGAGQGGQRRERARDAGGRARHRLRRPADRPRRQRLPRLVHARTLCSPPINFCFSCLVVTIGCARVHDKLATRMPESVTWAASCVLLQCAHRPC